MMDSDEHIHAPRTGLQFVLCYQSLMEAENEQVRKHEFRTWKEAGITWKKTLQFIVEWAFHVFARLGRTSKIQPCRSRSTQNLTKQEVQLWRSDGTLDLIQELLNCKEHESVLMRPLW